MSINISLPFGVVIGQAILIVTRHHLYFSRRRIVEFLQLKKIMCTVVGIPLVIALTASVCPSISYLKEKIRQEPHQLPPMRVASKLSRFFITLLVGVVCIFADTEITTTLPSNVLGGGRENNGRKLTTAGTYSFAYTGAAQTWYHPTQYGLCMYYILHHSPVQLLLF